MSTARILVVDDEQGRVLGVQSRQQGHGDRAVECAAPPGQHPDVVTVFQHELGMLTHQQLDAADDWRAGEMKNPDGAG